MKFENWVNLINLRNHSKINVFCYYILLNRILFSFCFRANGEEQRNKNVTITAKFYVESDPHINIYIFASLVAVSFLMNFFRTTYLYAILVRCSRQLHNLKFKAVLKAPMYFFNTNPVGEALVNKNADQLQLILLSSCLSLA